MNCVEIGTVTEGPSLRYFMDGEMVAEVPADSLVLGGGAPVYEREYKEPAYYAKAQAFDPSTLSEPSDLKEVARSLIGHVNIASKRWVTEQYDSMVGTINMSTNRPSDAGIVNVKGTDKAIAVTVDCNARYVFADPEVGCSIAVAEAARNIVCSGAKPAAITNCLNFGNPYNPEAYWQFVGAIKGMSTACKKFNTPVTGGNVSFYNQSTIEGKTVPVLPTPTIGMIGIVESKEHVTPLSIGAAGQKLILLGKHSDDMSSSQYLIHWHKQELSRTPSFDLEYEYTLQEVLYDLITKGSIKAAHDVSDGGLFTTLLEMSLPLGIGVDVEVSGGRLDGLLFGEAQSRVVLAVEASEANKVMKQVKAAGMDAELLGSAVGKDIVINGSSYGSVASLGEIFNGALHKMMS